MAQKERSQVEENDSAVAVEEEEKDPKEALKEVIKVNVSDAGILRKTVQVTVPRENIDEELDKEYKQIISDAIVPGFRRGRAPRRLVEKRFGGEVGSQVQTRLLSNAYLAAIEKEDLKVLGDPLIWVKLKDKKAKEDSREQLVDMHTALANMKLPEEGALEFKCEVEVKPQFELPSLEGVEIERPDIKITDEDVTVQIKRMQARRGNWVPVLGGKVEIDDLLICDMVMTVEGKEAKKAENIQIAARPQRIEGLMVEDLGDKFKGAKVGDAKTFEGELPDDYEVEEYRGKKAKIELKLNDIKRLELPPMNKEYLEAQGFDSEKEFREWVRKQMEGQLGEEIKRGMRNQARRYLLDKTKLELPEGLSSRQTDRAVLRMMIDLQRQGVPAADIEKHADELRTSARDQAVTELKLHFVLEDIAEKLTIDVTEEEINGQIAAMARTYNRRFDRVRDELAKTGGIESLYLQIRDDKCIDRILDKAKIVEAKASPKTIEEKPKKPAKAEQAAEKPEKETAEKPAKSAKAEKSEKKTPAPKASKPPAKKK